MKNIKNNCMDILLGCVFCHGTGIAVFVDMDIVPIGTSMIIGDDTWKKYEKCGACPDGCELLN
jgi:hypothetical protein